ncbi:sugar ABC transporter permease, partial [Streptomyces sp. NPDC057253]
MSIDTRTPKAAPAEPPSGTTPRNVPQGHKRLLTRRDRITLAFMAGVPTILHVLLVWVTAL